NDLRPLVDFPSDPIGEFLGRAGDRLESERGKALPYVGQRDDPDDLAMQAIDDVLRCSRWHQHAEDDFGFLTRPARFRQRRHVGPRGRTFAPVTASARTVPCLMCPAAVEMEG